MTVSATKVTTLWCIAKHFYIIFVSYLYLFYCWWQRESRGWCVLLSIRCRKETSSASVWIWASLRYRSLSTASLFEASSATSTSTECSFPSSAFPLRSGAFLMLFLSRIYAGIEQNRKQTSDGAKPINPVVSLTRIFSNVCHVRMCYLLTMNMDLRIPRSTWHTTLYSIFSRFCFFFKFWLWSGSVLHFLILFCPLLLFG